MARMVVIYKTPRDPKAFDQHYFEVHVPLAQKLPNLRKYEVSQGAILAPAGESTPYRIGTLYFDDMSAVRNAFASLEGRECAADRRILVPDDAGFQMYLFDSREV